MGDSILPPIPGIFDVLNESVDQIWMFCQMLVVSADLRLSPRFMQVNKLPALFVDFKALLRSPVVLVELATRHVWRLPKRPHAFDPFPVPRCSPVANSVEAVFGFSRRGRRRVTLLFSGTALHAHWATKSRTVELASALRAQSLAHAPSRLAFALGRPAPVAETDPLLLALG